MLILFWAIMLFWLVAEAYEGIKSKSFSTGLFAWLAIVFLGALTVGFPK